MLNIFRFHASTSLKCLASFTRYLFTQSFINDDMAIPTPIPHLSTPTLLTIKLDTVHLRQIKCLQNQCYTTMCYWLSNRCSICIQFHCFANNSGPTSPMFSLPNFIRSFCWKAFSPPLPHTPYPTASLFEMDNFSNPFSYDVSVNIHLYFPFCELFWIIQLQCDLILFLSQKMKWYCFVNL